MSRKSLRQQRRAEERDRVHIPHYSCSRIERPASAAASIAPDDFWARLGL
ncbi:hypothetical protein [Sphingobium ummariense]|uniref:Uncharacterized protein n=1 Tax=Sphingobium ummariense RL-3 TaxID=1346791 RepID=T0ITR8_9SPHN|nr:hypothetical protein [Sphingobium ummariense]EQB32225.1 hypothetical protein M529_10505 [Sphingobium ummariense RL-3]